ANDQQYAQAVSQAAENQQAVADINAQYQQALSDAANTQTSQAQAAANNYNSAVAKENDTYQGKLSTQQATNAENIKNAEVSLASATANANKSYEVATTNDVAVTGRVAKPQTDVKVPTYVTNYGIHLEVRGYNGAIPVSDYTYPEFANTYYGEYPDSAVITNKAAESTPHDISEMPLDFQPGLLSYDAKTDHSEKVSTDGLTADQVQVLRALSLSWENGFRNNVFQNYREFYNVVNKNDGFVNVAPVDLVSTDFTDNIANQVVANRTKYVPGTKTVTPTATDVQKATASEQQKLADVKAQAQQSLDALASAHQANLNKLEQQYNDAKAQVKANYDAAVTKAASVRDAALKATGAVDLQAYKAQLDSAYQNLVKADQVAAQKLAADRDAKIANIKKTENAKLDAKINELVPSIDPQIKQLQDQHQAVIAHGDAVLAELKAENKAAYNKLAEQFNVQLAAIQQREDAKRANEVRLANNTVVLPTAVKAANDGNVDTVAFPTVTNRLQAETTGRVQPVSAPSIVKTATQTPIAVAPVVTQTAAVVATANNGTQTPVASTADNKATKADNNEKSVVKADTVAKKQVPAKKSESSQKVDRSSMSIVALAATALLGTLGITYSSKKRHN
ncbi:hypothetical protein G8B26_06080, partial [Limosilactobacillus reuteri]